MVSVIIPTYNAGDSIERLLSSLRRQTIKCEIIIIDSSSSDDTIEIAQSYGIDPIRIRREEFNHGRARNRAAREGMGDRLVFLTQDCLPMDEDCIAHLIRPLEDPSIAASFGRHIPREDASPTERYTRLHHYPETPMVTGSDNVRTLGIRTFFFSNVCSAVRRKEYIDLGGFPENLLMFEDMLFAALLILGGYRVAYVPEARVIHSHAYTCSQHFRRHLDAGISFSRNPWFLEHAKSMRQGIDFLIGEIRYLLGNRAFVSVPYAFLEAAAKYSGYMIGLKYDRIPLFLRELIASKGG